jgi:hypothetical protein
MPKVITQQHLQKRLEIVQKLFDILKINDQNNKFYLRELDNSVEMQSQILALENDIKECFICSDWSCFKKKDGLKRLTLSMIKYIFKNMNYEMLATKKSLKNEEGTIIGQDTIYIIIKKME